MVNTKPVQSGKTTRQSFSKINEVIDIIIKKIQETI